MKSSLKLLCFAIVLTSLFAGCRKKEIPGPKGEPGTNGTGGNVSSSSQVFTIGQSQWQASDKFYTYTHASDLITQNVVDKGGIRVYAEKDGGWWEMPLADGDLLLQCGFKVGQIVFQFSDIHGEIPLQAPATRNYRLVIFSESARQGNPGTMLQQKTNITSAQ